MQAFWTSEIIFGQATQMIKFVELTESIKVENADLEKAKAANLEN